jgi:hypothetical protein
MGDTDRCGILFYSGSTTTDIALLLVAPAPPLLPFQYKLAFHTKATYLKASSNCGQKIIKFKILKSIWKLFLF